MQVTHPLGAPFVDDLRARDASVVSGVQFARISVVSSISDLDDREFNRLAKGHAAFQKHSPSSQSQRDSSQPHSNTNETCDSCRRATRLSRPKGAVEHQPLSNTNGLYRRVRFAFVTKYRGRFQLPTWTVVL